MKIVKTYNWRVQDHKGRWYTTRWHADEESIRIEHPEAVCIPSTLIERELPETEEEGVRLRKLSQTNPDLPPGWQKN